MNKIKEIHEDLSEVKYPESDTARELVSGPVPNNGESLLLKKNSVESNIEKAEENQKTFTKKQLINTLNYINFQDKTITVNLVHKKYNQVISRTARPMPCKGDFF